MNNLKVLNSLQNEGLHLKNLVNGLVASRLDPRIAEIMVEQIEKKWKTLDCLQVFEILNEKNEMQIFGCLAEFAALKISERQIFKQWLSAAIKYKRPKQFQLFFVGLFPIGSKSMEREVIESNKIFKKWGFFSKDLPFNKATFANTERKTLLPSIVRKQKLSILLKQQKEITIKDYQIFLDYKVSARVAEMDLKNCKLLQARFQTRRRVYRLKKLRR